MGYPVAEDEESILVWSYSCECLLSKVSLAEKTDYDPQMGAFIMVAGLYASIVDIIDGKQKYLVSSLRARAHGDVFYRLQRRRLPYTIQLRQPCTAHIT